MIKKINIGWLLSISVLSTGTLIWLLPYITFLPGWKSIAILIILLALTFDLLTERQEKKILLFVPAGLLIANMLKIIIDGISDPTSHNLWPFEIILLSITGLVSASIGVGISFVIKGVFNFQK